MGKAKWIWKYGEYEIYHHKLLMCRRQEMGCDYPGVIWRIAPNEVSVRFRSTMKALTDTTLRIVTHSKGMAYFGDQKYPVNEDLFFPAGEYEVFVMLYDLERFPCFFIDSEYLKTDESWEDWSFDGLRTSPGCEPAFYQPTDDPAVFPFAYEELKPVSVEEVSGGLLYDFGKETFGSVELTEYPGQGTIYLTYGESREEALDYSEALIREKLECSESCIREKLEDSESLIREKTEPGFGRRRPARAFRYIHTRSSVGAPVTLKAWYEYLPIEDIASFRCEDEQMNRIWDICAYTFHLNSREMYLDGIKRDRWCWSGDAYQSFFANYYLYFDPQIVKRTILGLLGKPPYYTHINTINDYSAYLIAAVWDYYYATGDREFVGRIWENLKHLYTFMISRTDENGYVVKRENDWIFIDWSEMDKDGILCAEQILLWNAHKAMGKLAELMCGSADRKAVDAAEPIEGNSVRVAVDAALPYELAAEKLKKNILRDFWDEEKGLFYDQKADGSRQITRHPNIFAIMYDFVEEAVQKRIAGSVIYSEEYVKITTPYFKLYELIAMCKLGDIRAVQDYISFYWGGMLKEGATTVWERYDPEATREEALAMYGMKYGTSLCHAWGSGPIYLLGRYCCGVKATDVGYRTFEVRPDFGRLGKVQATVPVRDGAVELVLTGNRLTVTATVSGGTLYYGGKSYVLPAGQAVVAVFEYR